MATEDENNSAQGSGEEEGQEKVQLDEQELDASASRAAQKVELDLDDAPFLDWEEGDEPEEEQPQAPAAAEEEVHAAEQEKQEQPSERPAWWKRKLTWALAGVLLLLLLAAPLGWYWLKHAAQDEATKPGPALSPEQIPAQAGQAREMVDLEPFWVEHQQGDELRFLHLQFTLALEEEDLAREIDRKTPALRDAVYYYLRKKDLVFLADQENADQLKSELASLLNQYLSTGQVQEVLIQDYLVR